MLVSRSGLRLGAAGLLVAALAAPTWALAETAVRASIPSPTRVGIAATSVSYVSATPSVVSRLAGSKRLAIRYRTSHTARVTMKVTNSSGTLVRTLLSSSLQSAGTHVKYWDLKTSSGSWAANGAYKISIYVVDTHGRRASPYPARCYATVDNTVPTASIASLTPPSMSVAIDESTTVTYRATDNRVGIPVDVRLEVFNSTGSLVRSVMEPQTTQASGKVIRWDGRTDGGSKVPAGAYTARVRVRDAAANVGYSGVANLYVSAFGAPRPLDATAYYNSVVRSDSDDTSGTTHVVWNDTTTAGKRVRYRRVDEFGNTVVGPIVVDSPVTLDSNQTMGVPDVAADAHGGAYVVWRGSGTSVSYHSIWLAHIDADGHVLFKRRVFDESNSSYNLFDPRVSCGPDGVARVVCWRDLAPSAVYFASFRSDGVTSVGWTALATSSVGGQRKYPNVEVDASNRIHVMWFDSCDYPSTSVGKRELYYTRLVFSGNHAASGTITKRRLTTSTLGYSPSFSWAPEMAPDGSGGVHVVWPDQPSGAASRGIAYLRLGSTGLVSISQRRVFDCTLATKPAYAAAQPSVVRNGSGARVVFRALQMTSGDPGRIWQLDVGSTGSASKPFAVSTGAHSDLMPSLTSANDGVARLVYLAETTYSAGSVYRTLVYRDLAAEPRANDRTRADLQVDHAHATYSSTPSPPRHLTPVEVTAEIRNAGWATSAGGTARLRLGDTILDTASIPTLAKEATAAVTLDWTIPDGATDTPALLTVSVEPSVGSTQTSSANDTATVPVDFLVPPTSARILVSGIDETFDQTRSGGTPLLDTSATLVGETAAHAPYVGTGESLGYWTQFDDVPLGTYTVHVSKAGFANSDPDVTVTVGRNPSDEYELVVTPSQHVEAWMNRWGAVAGHVTESGGATAVAGAQVTLMSSGEGSPTATDGSYALRRLNAGDYRIRVTKAGRQRQFRDVTVAQSATQTVDVEMPATGNGYLVGTITDTGGWPAVNDPDQTGDDPTLTVRRSNGTVYGTYTLHDGTFDVELPAGSYTMDCASPGYVTRTGIAASIAAGVETDKTTALALNVSDMTYKSSSEKWCVTWTMHANWFGTQIPGAKIPSYNVKSWWGMFRMRFNCAYQKVGLNTYIRSVDPWFSGEYWNDTYLLGVDPPDAPHTFFDGTWFPLQTKYYDVEPVADRTSSGLTALRIDAMDVIDDRTWTVVSRARDTWYSCDEPAGHRYGQVASNDEATPLPTYSQAVPLSNQVVRFWLTVGRQNDEGHFENSPFDSFGNFNQGDLFNGYGTDQLMMYYRPTTGDIWVEPGFADYPTPSP